MKSVKELIESTLVLPNNASGFKSLEQNLQELWGLRHLRNDRFAEAINLLQGLFALPEGEFFGKPSYQIVTQSLRLILEKGTVSDEDIVSITQIFEEYGLDPFRPMR